MKLATSAPRFPQDRWCAGHRLSLGFSWTGHPARLPGSMNGNRMLNAWLRIDPDGTVTIFTGKIELGQGIGTALAQIAADELDVDLKRIEVVTATPRARRTRARPPAASRSRTAARPFASPAPRRAHPARSPPRPRSSTAGHDLKVNRRHDQRAERRRRHLLGARPRARPQEAKRPRASSRSRRPSTSGSARASRATTFRRSSPAAPPTCRTSACPACCSAAWCVRRRRAQAAVRGRGGRCDACRAWSPWCATASFLGVAAEREEQAIKARELKKRGVEGRGRPAAVRRGAVPPSDGADVRRR